MYEDRIQEALGGVLCGRYLNYQQAEVDLNLNVKLICQCYEDLSLDSDVFSSQVVPNTLRDRTYLTSELHFKAGPEIWWLAVFFYIHLFYYTNYCLQCFHGPLYRIIHLYTPL
jgi:hypothetical protein